MSRTDTGLRDSCLHVCIVPLGVLARPDNIFAAEFSHADGSQAAGDAFLCICTAATQHTVRDVYDTDAPTRK